MAAYHRSREYVEGRRVLEIGCGEGIGASVLAEGAASVVAIDYSKEALRVARERYGAGNIEFTRMKIPPIDFPDMSFDAAVCFQMIEHLAEPGELVAEVGRVLRGGGIALFATVNKDETITDNPYHIHEFSAKDFEELLKVHFDTVEMFGVFGDELFTRYWQNNRRWANTFMRVDVFNLSARLPRALKQRLFDAASRLMRARLKRRDPELCLGITHENFIFRPDEFTGCLDFFAVCRRTSK
jgi:SAM-dependent methyltransferase